MPECLQGGKEAMASLKHWNTTIILFFTQFPRVLLGLAISLNNKRMFKKDLYFNTIGCHYYLSILYGWEQGNFCKQYFPSDDFYN